MLGADLFVRALLGLGKSLGITLCLLADVQLPQDISADPAQQVVAAQMTSAQYVMVRIIPKTAEERCVYSGVVVPYEQTWEEREVRFGNETIIPPKPGEIAGYGLIINRKDCDDGRPVEAMFKVGTHYVTLFNKDRMMKGNPRLIVNLDDLAEDMRPKWIPQVMDKIKEAAKTNQVAADFIKFNEEHAPKQEGTDTAEKTPENNASTGNAAAKEAGKPQNAEAADPKSL